MTSTSKRRRTNEQLALRDPVESTRPSTRSTSHVQSQPTQTEPEDWTSSSGSDSDSDSDADSDSATKPPSTTLPPSITANATPPTELHTRLTSFFSSLAEQRATTSTLLSQSEKIEIDSDSGFEDDDDDAPQGQYIELDLALGVLSEKGSDDEDGDGEIKVPGMYGGDVEADEDGDENRTEQGGLDGLLGVLAGSKTGRRVKKGREEQKRGIEEVG